MVFDPLGLVSPFVLRAKALVQRLWAMKAEWDQLLSGAVLTAWESWLQEMPLLESIKIPRCYKVDIPQDAEVVHRELHVYCDASELAFGAVAYLRMSCTGGEHFTAFVMSRTRLAPLKQLTIVRLELQAAVLGVRLANFVKKELACQVGDTFLWTDSTVVLSFLQNESRRFHTFVANRISEIQESSEVRQWRHVPSELNPADVCSRGASGPELRTCDLWWNGPAFLAQDEVEWPAEEVKATLDASHPEVKATQKAVFTAGAAEPHLLDPSRFSSWSKYKRVVAWVIRFGRNAKVGKGSDQRAGGPLTVPEIEAAEEFILKESQGAVYCEEKKLITSGGRLPAGSSLQHLSPFVDEQGLIRARGRLLHSPLPESSRHAILVGEKDIIRLIITDAHRRVLHSGVEQTLSEVRLSYWIAKARSEVKKNIYSCAYCRNRRAQPRAPIMADLPESRFDTSRPFPCVGID